MKDARGFLKQEFIDNNVPNGLLTVYLVDYGFVPGELDFEVLCRIKEMTEDPIIKRVELVEDFTEIDGKHCITFSATEHVDNFEELAIDYISTHIEAGDMHLVVESKVSTEFSAWAEQNHRRFLESIKFK